MVTNRRERPVPFDSISGFFFDETDSLRSSSSSSSCDDPPAHLRARLTIEWSMNDNGWRGGKRFEKFEKLFDRKYLIVFDGIFFFRCRRFFELIRYLDRLFYFFGWCIFWKLSIKFVHNFFAQCEKCCKIWKRKTQYTVRAADGRSVIAESSCWNEKRIVARLVFEEENEEGLITVWCRISIPSSTITLPKKKETIASSFLSSPKLKQFLPLSSISSFIERETKRGRGNV